ncbi:MAG: hypothetical protein WBG51_07830, partial [Syntrophobacteria bacterium]
LKQIDFGELGMQREILETSAEFCSWWISYNCKFGLGSNIGHGLFVGWVEHPDIFCWVSFLYPTFYEGCQVLFFIFFELAIPLDKPHLLLMSTQDPIYPFMP